MGTNRKNGYTDRYVPIAIVIIEEITAPCDAKRRL
jgi:hypothetical protein